MPPTIIRPRHRPETRSGGQANVGTGVTRPRPPPLDISQSRDCRPRDCCVAATISGHRYANRRAPLIRSVQYQLNCKSRIIDLSFARSSLPTARRRRIGNVAIAETNPTAHDLQVSGTHGGNRPPDSTACSAHGCILQAPAAALCTPRDAGCMVARPLERTQLRQQFPWVSVVRLR